MKTKFYNSIFLIFCSHLCFALNTIELKKVGLKITVPDNFIRISSDQVESYKKNIGNSIKVCDGTKQGLDKALSNPNFELLLNTLDFNETIIVVKFPKFDTDKKLLDKLQNKIKETCFGNAQINFEYLNSAEGKSPIGSYISTLSKVQNIDISYFSESFFISSLNATYLITSNSSKIVGNYELIRSISELDIEDKDNFIEQYKHFYQAGDILRGISVLDEAVRRNPNKAKYYFLRATALNTLKNYNAALQDADKYLQFDKDNIDCLILKGLIKISLKKHDESIEDLNRAGLLYSIYTLANKPFESTFGLSYISSLLAMNYDAKEDYDMALKNITQAINSDEGESSYYFLRGNIYMEKEDFKKAIPDFTKSINLGYKNIGRVYFTRSLAYFSINDSTRGCEDLVKAEKFGYKNSKINSLKQFCK